MMDPKKLSVDDLIDYVPADCLGEDFPLYWQMTRAERFCLMHLLGTFKPELALEIGTYKGGSLQVLSRYSEKVVSIDIDAGVAATLQGLFDNVDFRSGDSRTILPAAVSEINASDKRVSFVLIDGDHSEEGVRRDTTAVLNLIPKRPICVVMHDSFHPPCRLGMRAVNWAASPYVHYVELDFVSGVFLPGRRSADHSMFGGFAVALMLPEKRDFELQIFESQRSLFETVHRFAPASGFLAKPTGEASDLLLQSVKAKLRAFPKLYALLKVLKGGKK